MSWIRTIAPDQASGKLAQAYKRVSGPGGQVDNILQVHALRPHTLVGHMTLYKSVLHHSGNELPRITLELLGVWASMLNRCSYCVEHHFSGFKKLTANDAKADCQRKALESGVWDPEFGSQTQAMLRYCESLTCRPGEISENEIESMRAAGLTDGQILEVNQVTAYFNYANRTVLGLGVSLDGDVLGTSPNQSEDETNWHHSLPGEHVVPPYHAKHSTRGSVPSKRGFRPTLHTVHGKAFSARHIEGGDLWFDLFFRLSAGMMAGGAIGMVLYFGPNVPVSIEGKWLAHPITNGIAFGFFFSVPVCILYYLANRIMKARAKRQGLPAPTRPRYIGRPAIAITTVLTWVILWIAEAMYS
jgi:uncharacterized peroxidase-related enzyme